MCPVTRANFRLRRPVSPEVNAASASRGTVQGRVVLLGGDPAFRQQIDWSRIDQYLAKLIAPALPKST
jgi:hypothetical protein